MASALWKPWVGLLALGGLLGCGESKSPPRIGDNLMNNSSFEEGLQGWWTSNDSEGGAADTRPEAASTGSSARDFSTGMDASSGSRATAVPGASST